MKITIKRLIVHSAVVLALLNSCSKATDMESYDKWLGEKFNQNILWNPDSLAFRRADWVSDELYSGVSVRKASVKMWGSVQSISYVSYSPTIFNTKLSVCDGSAATTGELASRHETALFAINGGNTDGNAPADYLKFDGEVLKPGTENISVVNGALAFSTSDSGESIAIHECPDGNYSEFDKYNSVMAAGPVLVSNGKVMDFPQGEFYDTRMSRSIIGISSTGNNVMVTIDKAPDGSAAGATVSEAAFIASLLNLTDAVCLAPADDVTLWSSSKGVLNTPSSGAAKPVATIIYVESNMPLINGKGTEDDPYIIESAIHMTQIRNLAKLGAETYFKLEYDIDMKDVRTWTPANYDQEFTRKIHFDGNNKSIINFSPDKFVDDSDPEKQADYPSLFGVLYGSCRDLTITDSKIVVADNVPSCGFLGGYVGTSGKPAVVENVHVSGEISGGSNLGGLGGQSREATYRNCSADVVLRTGGTDVGGFVGKGGVSISMENCSANVDIAPSKQISKNIRYGGLIGWSNNGTLNIVSCHTEGEINGTLCSANSASGLVAYVGADQAVISKSYSEVSLTGGLSAATGKGGKVSNSGGIIGTLSTTGSCTIENCYSSGDWNPWQCSGGILGRHEKGSLKIINTYSTSVIVGYSGLGAIIGQSAKNLEVNMTSCFAWSPSITAFRDSDDKYSSGAVIGCASGVNTISGTFRNPAMKFTDPYRSLGNHSDIAAGTPEGAANQNAYDGMPSESATLSDAAKKAGWSSSIWDFTGSEPKLK